MSDEEIKVPCVQKTIALIYETFKGVTREGGTSWSETYVIDDDGTEEEQRFARLRDRERCWEELANNRNWDHGPGSGGFAFLDPIGYRYYLPAAMIKELRGQGGSMGFSLGLDEGKLREHRLHLWSALTPNEIQCVCNFLKCMDATELWRSDKAGLPQFLKPTQWRTEYLSYWVSVDKCPMP